VKLDKEVKVFWLLPLQINFLLPKLCTCSLLWFAVTGHSAISLRLCPISFSVTLQSKSGLDHLFLRFRNHTQLETHTHTFSVGFKWSTCRRDRYLHNKHKRWQSLPSVGFEPAIEPQTYTLDCAATRIGVSQQHYMNPLNAKLNPIRNLLALLWAHHIFHVSELWVNSYVLLCGCLLTSWW
jgi:hypothetical protein